MRQGIDEIRENVAFMRQIITEARESALGDGLGFIAAGLLFGLAGIGAFVANMEHIAVPGGTNGLFGLAALLFLAHALSRRGGVKAASANSDVARIARLARAGLILALVTLLLGFYLSSADRTMLAPMAPVVVFAIYGGAWLAAAGLTTATWPRWVAGLSYATALLLALLSGTPWQLLTFGIGMLVLAFAPGLIVWRMSQRRWPD